MADYYSEFYTDEVDAGVAKGDASWRILPAAFGGPDPTVLEMPIGTDLKALVPELVAGLRYDFDTPSVGSPLPASALIESVRLLFYNDLVAIVDPGVGGGGDAGTGYFRIGHLENDGIWNHSVSKGWVTGVGAGEYANAGLLPRPTDSGSDVINPGVVYGDVFLGTIPYTPATFPAIASGGNPHTAGDSNYAPAPDFTLAGLGAAVTTRLAAGERRIAFIFDPFQVPAAVAENVTIITGDTTYAGLPLGWWGPKLQINYNLPKTGFVPGAKVVDRIVLAEVEGLAAVSPEYAEAVGAVESGIDLLQSVSPDRFEVIAAVDSQEPEVVRLVRQAIVIPVPPPPVVLPSIDPYTPGNPAPPNSFDFGLLADEFVIETDDTMASLLTDPNGAGFSFGAWFKQTPGNSTNREGICGSSDSYLLYSEGAALTGWGTPPPAAIRFFVEDIDDLQPANWTETAAAAADDNLWHFACCVWNPLASGASRVRMYFDGVLAGVGGAHAGDLTEAWARKFWIGKAYANSSGLIAFEGNITHITLWDGPLTAPEAFELWGGGLPPNLDTMVGFESGLKLWYHPNDYTPGAGAVVTDHSGSGNHAKDAGVDSPVGVAADIPT